MSLIRSSFTLWLKFLLSPSSAPFPINETNLECQTNEDLMRAKKGSKIILDYN